LIFSRTLLKYVWNLGSGVSSGTGASPGDAGAVRGCRQIEAGGRGFCGSACPLTPPVTLRLARMTATMVSRWGRGIETSWLLRIYQRRAANERFAPAWVRAWHYVMRGHARKVTAERHHQFGIHPNDLLQPRRTNCAENPVLARRRRGGVGAMTEQRHFAAEVTFAGQSVWSAPCHRSVDAPLR
jgi:hypothetical protein